MKLSIDKEKCISCGQCISLNENYFQFNDDGSADIKKEVIEKDDIEEIKNIKESCPTDAISIT